MIENFQIKEIGLCNLSVVPVRQEANDTAEIVTQLLFGEAVRIKSIAKPWIEVELIDETYAGWMDYKQLTYLSTGEFETYRQQEFIYLNDPLFRIVGPRGVQNIMLGSKIPKPTGNTFILGKEIFNFDIPPNSQSYTLLETALGYLNTPYLWGGKSIFGIDCSGFTQTVFKIHGVFLPRDASQQITHGKTIQFADRKPGDVPFFINQKGKVHHVGILTNPDEILHASGAVRKDRFDEQGIFRADINEYTHQLHSIKRYI